MDGLPSGETLAASQGRDALLFYLAVEVSLVTLHVDDQHGLLFRLAGEYLVVGLDQLGGVILFYLVVIHLFFCLLHLLILNTADYLTDFVAQ